MPNGKLMKNSAHKKKRGKKEKEILMDFLFGILVGAAAYWGWDKFGRHLIDRN